MDRQLIELYAHRAATRYNRGYYERAIAVDKAEAMWRLGFDRKGLLKRPFTCQEGYW